MKTIYPQKQLSTADVEEMRKKRLEIYKKHLANMQTNIDSFYDTSAKQSQGEDFKPTPDKKVLTAEDFKPKHDDSVGMDQNPFSYSKLEVEDGTVCYIHKKTGSIISESTYRSLVKKKEEVYFKEPSDVEKENILKKQIKNFLHKENTKAKPADMVNHPPHYNVGGFEVIDIIQAFTQDLNGIAAVDTANAIKYILRWHNKNGIEDLKKARWYIDHLIKKLEEWENDR